MAEALSEGRLAQISRRAPWLFQITYQDGGSPQEDIRDLLAEVDRLREELAEARRGRMRWSGPGSLTSAVEEQLQAHAEFERRTTALSCLSCSEPAEDSGEGRYCGSCEDYEGTCVNDHCLTCGRTT